MSMFFVISSHISGLFLYVIIVIMLEFVRFFHFFGFRSWSKCIFPSSSKPLFISAMECPHFLKVLQNGLWYTIMQILSAKDFRASLVMVL